MPSAVFGAAAGMRTCSSEKPRGSPCGVVPPHPPVPAGPGGQDSPPKPAADSQKRRAACYSARSPPSFGERLLAQSRSVSIEPSRSASR